MATPTATPNLSPARPVFGDISTGAAVVGGISAIAIVYVVATAWVLVKIAPRLLRAAEKALPALGKVI